MAVLSYADSGHSLPSVQPPALTRSSDETPRFDPPARRCDGGGARPSRTAQRDAGDRFPRREVGNRTYAFGGRIPPRSGRGWLYRGSGRGGRIPLGGGGI